MVGQQTNEPVGRDDTVMISNGNERRMGARNSDVTGDRLRGLLRQSDNFDRREISLQSFCCAVGRTVHDDDLQVCDSLLGEQRMETAIYQMAGLKRGHYDRTR